MANWRGTWASGTAYAAGDSVSYGGTAYYCVTTNTGHAPGTDGDWALMDTYVGGGATGTSEGGIELAGDLGGTAASPQVTGTHLASPLPLAQGGTAAGTAAGARTALGLGAAALLPTPVPAASLPGPSDWLNVVTQYGADPAGAADSTSAIQAAINAAATGSGTVYIPAGSYKLTSALTVPSYVSITGAGLWKTLLVQHGTTANGITIPGTSGSEILGVRIRDLSILGPGQGTGSGIGLSTAWAPNAIYENVRSVLFGGDGVYQTNCWDQYFSNCIFDSNGGDGYHGVTAINACTWINTQFGSNTLAGFHLNGGAGWSLISCDIEANQQHGANLEVSYDGVIMSTDFEVNNQSAGAYSQVYAGSSQSLAGPQILSCNFSGGAKAVNGVQVHAALNTIIQGCEFLNHTAQDVLIDSGSTGTTLGPNTFQAGSTSPRQVTDNGRYTVRPSMLTLTGQAYALARNYAMP